MSTIQRIIKAPAVDNLNSIKNIIQSLELIPIPLSFIDEGHLQELEENGKILPQVHEAINEWKEQQGISSTIMVFLQPIVSLLKSLDIVESTKIEKDDLDLPLGSSGPMMSTFLTKSVDAVRLTKTGFYLLKLLRTGDRKSQEEYDNILFWKFLRSNIIHNFQRAIEDSNSYEECVTDVLERFDSDTRSRGCFLNWIRYFDLKGIENDNAKLVLSKKNVIKKIISSTILELNTLEHQIYEVETLSNQISQQLDLARNRINFLIIFEIILSHVHDTNEDEIPIAGTVSTRSMHSRSLPNFPRINMLKISDDISMLNVLEQITEHEFNSVLIFGDENG